ncbi:hypothetical protein GCM10009122_00480 [Fulvivirga kasyanovii]|uniref:DUF4129 domain-containing protein n=1 Tax=Fulvivirga kasyanovii TaxID=396812 RepID=A0ABW9RI10_9BACT|nr:hypothetical protein [Fulvivirga kasyanovii]MTI23532.1 hypothetical protein [Fulvivirga kasyanovii]
MSTISLQNSIHLENRLRPIDFIARAINGVKLFFGLFGIVVLAPLLLCTLPFAILYFARLNRKMKNVFDQVYNEIDTTDERALMEMHLHAEDMLEDIKHAKKTANIFEGAFITKPVAQQLHRLCFQVKNFEETIKNAAYPHIDTPLSDEDVNYLVKKFEQFEDWNASAGLTA